MKGKHQLSKETRRDFARYIVFLRSDCHPVEPTAEQVASRRKGFNVLLGAALVIVAALVATAIVNFNLALAIIAGMALLYVLACAILRLYFDAVRWLFGAKPIERTPQQAIWPFANESDYCAALQTAGYLGRSGK
ncbi:MAG: hypothetical protein K2W85_10660 [Phycisphaerales bacterium]|nr:hypothetical protein [Phycisphaerales bacterium]